MEARFCRQRVLRGGVVTVVLVLVFDGWDVADLALQSVGVEPSHPAHGGRLQIVYSTPGTCVAHALGLVQAHHALGEGIVSSRQLLLIRWVRRVLCG